MKSDINIEDDLYDIVEASDLASAINGDIYPGPDERPMASEKEDIEIIVIANMNGEVQKSTISVNIYVKDIMADGQYRRNRPRIRTLANLAKTLFETINKDGYRLTLESQNVFKEGQVHQHYINNKLSYKFYNR